MEVQLWINLKYTNFRRAKLKFNTNQNQIHTPTKADNFASFFFFFFLSFCIKSRKLFLLKKKKFWKWKTHTLHTSHFTTMETHG